MNEPIRLQVSQVQSSAPEKHIISKDNETIGEMSLKNGWLRIFIYGDNDNNINLLTKYIGCDSGSFDYFSTEKLRDHYLGVMFDLVKSYFEKD